MHLPLLSWAYLALSLSLATANVVHREDPNYRNSDSSDDNDNGYSSIASFSSVSFTSASATQSATGTTTSFSSSPSSGSATSSASASSASSSIFGDLTGLNGDTQCSTAMCVYAVVKDSTVEYVLQNVGSSTPGWMAMGFGSQMAGAQMVIMWANSDNSITLSQRTASGEIEPSVDSSPDRTATQLSNITSIAGSSSYYGFSVPTNSDTTQTIIWAVSSDNPDSSDASADIQQHDNEGVLSLDLTKSFTSASGSSSGSSDSNTVSIPLTAVQKKVIAHAVLSGFGFLVVLPFGALLARYLRTFSPTWFLGHSIVQFYLAGTLILIGFALGVSAVSEAGSGHLIDTHRRWGVAVFVLYLVQCGLGAFIHWVKFPTKAIGFRARPPQNYAHAILGLLVLAFAFYQVFTGYKKEWPLLGRGTAPAAVNRAFIAWAVLLPLFYFAGLALLPRQIRQENSNSRTVGASAATPRMSYYRSRSASNAPARGNEHENEAVSYYHGGGGSSVGHGDPDADDIGLTQLGRANQRAQSSGGGRGRWSDDQKMHEAGYGLSVFPSRK